MSRLLSRLPRAERAEIDMTVVLPVMALGVVAAVVVIVLVR
jgi:hypothetical protein